VTYHTPYLRIAPAAFNPRFDFEDPHFDMFLRFGEASACCRPVWASFGLKHTPCTTPESMKAHHVGGQHHLDDVSSEDVPRLARGWGEGMCVCVGGGARSRAACRGGR
jgi:hypothetical protein